ncbi:MAG: TonB-dependent receptor [bacterium]|nr:TonB-dependent receptor [bacterium]
MKCLILIISFIFFLSTSECEAQTREISGRITNKVTGEPVCDLSVSIKDNLEISITDNDGYYTITVPDSLTNISFHDFPTMNIEEINIISANVINLVLSNKKLSVYDTPIEELVKIDVGNIEVISASLKVQNIDFAPSNITVITREMIDNRGYKSLVEICEDIPGFDFFVFNDGGGEYPTFNMNRGVGTIGNTKMLIMVDGIIQNNISFNWSLLWTCENLLNDIDKIEIIEGPGSSIYGAQAFSGIIHFITRKNFNGIEVKPFYGSNKTYGIDMFLGKNFKNNANLSIAFHKYYSVGDDGDRYDPGNYFHNIQSPSILTADYDVNGNYVTDINNPVAGELIKPGFQTSHNSYSVRAKLNLKRLEIGMFLWESNRGLGSYVAAYEYKIAEKNNQSGSRGYHVYTKNETIFNDKLSLKSNLVFRSTNILPETGFSYQYKFPNMIKSYASYSYQTYLEEQLSYILSKKIDFMIGLKGTVSLKSQRIISLNHIVDNITETESSWEEADSGNGLNVKETVPVFPVTEIAAYAVCNNQWTDNIASSLGIRYDNSSEYGGIFNPRLSLIFKPFKQLGIKILYGTAFKQPSVFELNSEFRGNPNLDPERISTFEGEIFNKFNDNKIKLKTNVFYSQMKDFIGKIADVSMPSGERYENKDKYKIFGGSFEIIYKIFKSVKLYANYMFLLGKDNESSKWKQIERTAQHKSNAGVTVSLFDKKLNINTRLNFVSKRKAQPTNTWMMQYEGGYAPSYTKVNFAISYKAFKHFIPQVIIKNLLNTQYYGIGRESGSGFIDDYDYQTYQNPAGFIPEYHLQEGLTILCNINFALDFKSPECWSLV